MRVKGAAAGAPKRRLGGPAPLAGGLLLAVASLAAPAAHAQQVAVFGDNAVDNFIDGLTGFTATLVTDAQLATPGFLDAFDALVYTRNGDSFGAGLSVAAAKNVREYVGSSGAYVLLNADFADELAGNGILQTLFGNAVGFAAASGHGFVGEFTGAVAAVSTNANGFEALDLVAGSAGPLGSGNGGSSGVLFLASVGHPVVQGLPLLFDPAGVEFGADLSGAASGSVLATFGVGGNPGILAGTASSAVDLALSIAESTADPAIAGAGAENIVHTVTLHSRGPTATGLEIRSQVFLPAGVSLASVSPSAGTLSIGAVPAGTGIRLDIFWGFPSFATDRTETLTIRLTAGPSADDQVSVSHDSEVSTIDQRRRNLGDDFASEDTLIRRRVTLQLAKTDSPDPVVPTGAPVALTHTVLLTNDGPSDVGGLTLSDVLTLPSGVTVQAIQPAPGTAFAGTTWTVPAIAAGGSRTLIFLLSVDPSTATGTDVIGDTVAVTAAPSYVTNPTASAFQATSVLRLIDLVVGATESVDPVVAGSGPQNLTYSVTLSNSGPSVATGVRLSSALSLPSGATLDAAIPSGTTTFAGSIWEVGTLEVGGSATLTLVITVGASAAAASGAIVDALAVAAANETRTNTGDDAASLSTSVARHADLDLAKTDLVDPVQAGSSLTYLLTLTNDGPSDSTGATVADTLPAQVTLVSATPSQGLCAPAPSAFTCSLGPLARGASATMVATVTVASTASGTITNPASVTPSASDFDPAGSNNAALALTTVLGQANLALAKADSPDPVFSGNTLTYQLTAENLGPGEATGVVLTDVLPAGVSFVSAGPPAFGCAHSAGVVTCGLGTLAPSASAVVDLVVSVGSSTSGTLVNVATVVGNQSDPSPANNTATAATIVDPPYDLGLSLADAPDPVPLGGTLVYTLGVSNAGPGPATGVSVSDTLPGGVVPLAATPSQGSCALGSGLATCSLGSLASGATATIQLQARVDPGAGATLVNTASVSAAAGTDTDPADNSATVSTAVDAAADLALAIGDAPDPVTVGGTLTYTLAVTNAGPALAYGVTVTDPLPAGLSLLAAQTSQGTCSAGGGTVSCSLGTVASGAGATVTLQAQVGADAPATLVNTAAVAAGGPDPNPANGSAAATTTVGVGANLALSMTDSPDPAAAGGRVTYTFTVQNLGPSAATGIVLTDLLPPGASLWPPPPPSDLIFADGFESGNFSAWSVAALGPAEAEGEAGPDSRAAAGVTGCTQSGSTVSCPLGSLAPGETLVFALEVTLDPQSSGTVTNQASVAGNPADPDPANNSATATTAVQRRIDLALSLADNPDPVAPGATLTYSLLASNAGPSTATGVAVSDPLPPELAVLSATATQGSCTPASHVTCALGTLAAGGQAQVTIQAAVASGASGSLTNAASVAANEEELDLSNNSAAEVTALGGAAAAGAPPPDPGLLSATLVVRGEAREGGTVTYRLSLANRGAVAFPDAAGDEVVDLLPVGLQLLGAFVSEGQVAADLAGNRVRWSGEIPARGRIVLTFAARVEPGAAGQELANQALIFYDGDANGTLEGSLASDDPTTPGEADPTSLTVGGEPPGEDPTRRPAAEPGPPSERR